MTNDIQMFGCKFDDILNQFGEMDRSEKLSAAMSILSDAQEELDQLTKDRCEKARQKMNVAKWLISEVKSEMRRPEPQDYDDESPYPVRDLNRERF